MDSIRDIYLEDIEDKCKECKNLGYYQDISVCYGQGRISYPCDFRHNCKIFQFKRIKENAN